MENCGKVVVARGMCRMHYSRWHKHGDPLAVLRNPTPVGVCQREGCANPVKNYKISGAKRSGVRKYCSSRCYYDSGQTREYKPRSCTHCSESYVPVTSKQIYCFTCLGPAIGINKHGSVVYAGHHRLYRYGVSHPEWLAMLGRFEGMCWICKARKATDLDHCHKTEAPRGALCSRCNNRMQILDREDWFRTALAYLSETGVAF